MAPRKKLANTEKGEEAATPLEVSLEGIKRVHGSASIGTLAGMHVKAVPVLSSGSFAIDFALGVGGYPRGRIIEIIGPESSGKSTLALHAIASCQSGGGVAAFIDAEHALDLKYAKAIGVDPKCLLLSQPDNGEMALDIVNRLAGDGVVQLIVVDSVAALTPKAEIEGNVGDFHIGLQARLMSQEMRKLCSVCHRSQTAVIFINQIRYKVAVLFGSNETTPGGNALKFYTSVRLDIRRKEKIKGAEADVGNRSHVRIIKNKVAPPFQECDIDIIWGVGIDRIGDLISVGITEGVLEKSEGAWIKYGGESIGHGIVSASKALAENPKLRAEIEGKVRELVTPVG